MQSLQRRRFQFSLRWLALAFTLVAVLLGLAMREAAIVSERKQIREWLNDHAASLISVGTLNEFERQRNSISFWRRWLGDSYFVGHITVHNCSDAELQRVRSAFPEATVDRYSADNALVP